MNEAMAWFPMTADQATESQRRCAHRPGTGEATGLALGDTLVLGEREAMGLVLIPAGEYLMGTREDDPTHGPDQGPQHRVRFSKPFYLGRHPVTQARWQAVMGTNPAHFQDRPDHPIENVSWEACVAFCEAASVLSGRRVRLPSEAEWEYACRAGSDTTYHFGNDAGLLDQYGWYRGNSGMVSQPVGGKLPNAWGLYDMHGGIDEYVQDNWHGSHAGAPADGSARVKGGKRASRTLKGGSWYDPPEFCGSAHRNYYRHDEPSEDHGCRVVVEVE